jgi:hypothetical protein
MTWTPESIFKADTARLLKEAMDARLRPAGSHPALNATD